MAARTDILADASSSPESLSTLVEQALSEARRHGASAAEASTSVGQGLSVTVRLGEVETVEHTRDKHLGITVYFGQRSGSASTSDFSAQALADTVRAACSIARYIPEDPCAGLADPDRLARKPPELDLYHPWALPTSEAIALARTCEEAARQVDPRIKNSEGASVSSHEGVEVYGNSNGFIGTIPSTRHSLSCSVIAQDEAGMQRDYWYTSARAAAGLERAEDVGRRAGERALRRLGARKLSTREVAVIYEAPVATSLLSHFVSAIRGANLYRRASFLLDHLGKPVFPQHVRIFEDPHIQKGLGSAPFDGEGVATTPRDIVSGGVLQAYVLDSYSARKLGMQTTGNAGGVHNLTIGAGALDLDALLREAGTALLVTELIGFGVNLVTGDYSRGAAGFWVENGEIQFPVEEVTVAGNLKHIFAAVQAVGSDVDTRGNIRTGSLLIDRLTVAGD